MMTESDYRKPEVETCLSVMVELISILGAFRDNIAVVGGWIPYFLCGEKGKKHVGSLDVDIAFDFRNISEESYKTILQLLEDHGYKEGEQPFIFLRRIKTNQGIMEVEIDLVAGEYGGTGGSHRTQKIQDVRARKARGCDLVFNNFAYIEIEAKMPDGAKNSVKIKASQILPFLIMKGMAIWERYKEKDAYDIYFVVKNYEGGIQKLKGKIKPFLGNKLVREGLEKIKAKFEDVNSVGPVWIANFLEIEDEEDREMIMRDAFESVNEFLDSFQIKPFKNKEKFK
jgi:hypothetical protein